MDLNALPFGDNAAVQRLGIVDLGSNTARLVVFAYVPGRWYRLIGQIREPVRLGEGLWAGDGSLTQAAMDRAEAALKLYAEYAQATDLAEVEVMATSAVREGKNSTSFLQRLDRVHLPVRILTGDEEARYSVLAVANSFALDDAWVVDLGGGSAQISLMAQRSFESGGSFPLGAVRLTEAFLGSDPPRASQIRRLESHVMECLGSQLEAMRAHVLPVVAMGGSIRNLARAVQRAQSYPLDQRHGYFLKRQDLEELTARLLTQASSKRAAIAGILPERADIIHAAALVYRKIVQEADLPGVWISGQGVREGAFYSRFFSLPHRTDDVRRFAVNNLFQHYRQPLDHTSRVRRLSQRLFDELEPLHKLGDAERQLLDAAALLHDIGLTVNYYDHHKHGAYLIETAGLSGFTHRELAIVSTLVRYHRKGTPKWGPLGSLVKTEDKSRLLALSVCLRLAEHLERSQAGRVEDVAVDIRKTTVRLTLVASERPFVELWEARKQAALFELAFGRKLKLREPRALEAEPA